MTSGSRWWLLCLPLGVACGSEPAPLPSDDNPELPHLHDPGADGGVSSGGRDASRDGALRPGDVLDDESACAASTVAAEQVTVEETVEVPYEVTEAAPVALYVLFDRSVSMSSRLWAPATQAFEQFVRDEDSSGIDLAIQYFPNNTGSCDGRGYASPSVPMGTLPGNADAIVASVEGQSPSGIGTPIEGALRGATSYCAAYQLAHPEEKCIAVVVTDGKPEWDDCEKNSANLTAIAKAAHDASNSVRTFAVGLQGADFDLLDAIARAGNEGEAKADCDPSSARYACDVSSGPDMLSSALAKIRDTVTTTRTRTETRTVTQNRPLTCEWKMPTPVGDEALDLDRVNVTLRGGDGALQLGRVPSEAACQAGGWHYDDATAPTRIIACPQTCDAIEAGSYTDVKILLGCQTTILVI